MEPAEEKIAEMIEQLKEEDKQKVKGVIIGIQLARDAEEKAAG